MSRFGKSRRRLHRLFTSTALTRSSALAARDQSERVRAADSTRLPTGRQRPADSKHILMMCTTDLALPNASSIHFLSVARGFQKLGNRVDIYCGGAPLDASDLNTTTVASNSSKSIFLGKMIMIIKYFGMICINLRRLRRIRYDFIYIRTSSLTYPVVVLAKCFLRGPVITEHNGWIADEARVLGLPRWSTWAQARLQRAEAKVSDLVRAVTPGLKRVLVEHGVASEKIVVIGNGTDTRMFQPIDKTLACARVGLPADRPVVGFVGNLVAWQGVERLLDILPTLLAKVPDLTTIVAGDGPILDGLRHRADELGVSHAVRFYGWYPHSEVRNLICCFDVAVAPFIEDRNARIGLSPLKIRDYAACGRAIVTTGLPGLRELADEGMLVACDTSQAAIFAAEVLSLLQSRERRLTLGRKARHVAESNFDWEIVSAKILASAADSAVHRHDA